MGPAGVIDAVVQCVTYVFYIYIYVLGISTGSAGKNNVKSSRCT